MELITRIRKVLEIDHAPLFQEASKILKIYRINKNLQYLLIRIFSQLKMIIYHIYNQYLLLKIKQIYKSRYSNLNLKNILIRLQE